MTNIKKRGRPKKNNIEPAVTPVEKIKKESNIVNTEHRSKIHIINEIIDYIEKNAGKYEKEHIKAQASLRKWSTRYYIYKNLIGFFGIDDKTFDEKSLK